MRASRRRRGTTRLLVALSAARRSSSVDQQDNDEDHDAHDQDQWDRDEENGGEKIGFAAEAVISVAAFAAADVIEQRGTVEAPPDRPGDRFRIGGIAARAGNVLGAALLRRRLEPGAAMAAPLGVGGRRL